MHQSYSRSPNSREHHILFHWILVEYQKNVGYYRHVW